MKIYVLIVLDKIIKLFLYKIVGNPKRFIIFDETIKN